MDRRGNGDQNQGDEAVPQVAPVRHRVRLPRFIAAEPVGLGDVAKKVTIGVGVKPCSACQERAARLNRWLQFVPHR
jgi:hypothetical protein